jgi:Lrp/AsnC family transcriptional regulator
MSEELSHFDLRILQQIQRDATLSTIDLSEKVGLSQSPCWRRLQRLRDEGYVKRQVAIIDRSKFGQSLILYATLKMGTLTDNERAEFNRKLEITSEILECYSIIGERDVLMKIVAPSMDWYQNFIFKTLMKMPGVIDVQSIVAVAEMKYTTEIPLSGGRTL